MMDGPEAQPAPDGGFDQLALQARRQRNERMVAITVARRWPSLRFGECRGRSCTRDPAARRSPDPSTRTPARVTATSIGRFQRRWQAGGVLFESDVTACAIDEGAGRALFSGPSGHRRRRRWSAPPCLSGSSLVIFPTACADQHGDVAGTLSAARSRRWWAPGRQSLVTVGTDGSLRTTHRLRRRVGTAPRSDGQGTFTASAPAVVDATGVCRHVRRVVPRFTDCAGAARARPPGGEGPCPELRAASQ
jgi:hypothetical protein